MIPLQQRRCCRSGFRDLLETALGPGGDRQFLWGYRPLGKDLDNGNQLRCSYLYSGNWSSLGIC